jgi:hypothetical protein
MSEGGVVRIFRSIGVNPDRIRKKNCATGVGSDYLGP